MTKDTRTARRADDWTFQMREGLATHLPTGIVFRFVPAHAPAPTDVRGKWAHFGMVQLPEGLKDRRPAHEIAPGDANAPEAHRWHVLANETALAAARAALELEHGARTNAMLERIAREAGERWIFRARLERNWTTGTQRAT